VNASAFTSAQEIVNSQCDVATAVGRFSAQSIMVKPNTLLADGGEMIKFVSK
jgi:hypothetical protein